MMDAVMKIYEDLKKDLEKAGFVINNENGISNSIIIALSKAYGEGKEQGKKLGRIKTLEKIERKVLEMS